MPVFYYLGRQDRDIVMSRHVVFFHLDYWGMRSKVQYV
jgi:hypothetical protein